MKKKLLFSIILISLLGTMAAEASFFPFQNWSKEELMEAAKAEKVAISSRFVFSNGFPMDLQYRSKDLGGSKTVREAYSDGVGLILIGGPGTSLKNTLGSIIYKYQDKVSEPIIENVYNQRNNSSIVDPKDIPRIEEAYNSWKNNSIINQVPQDGVPCDDNNMITVNDVYLNGICQGALATSGTYVSDGEWLSLAEIESLGGSKGYCINGYSQLGLRCGSTVCNNISQWEGYFSGGAVEGSRDGFWSRIPANSTIKAHYCAYKGYTYKPGYATAYNMAIIKRESFLCPSGYQKVEPLLNYNGTGRSYGYYQYYINVWSSPIKNARFSGCVKCPTGTTFFNSAFGCVVN